MERFLSTFHTVQPYWSGLNSCASSYYCEIPALISDAVHIQPTNCTLPDSTVEGETRRLWGGFCSLINVPTWLSQRKLDRDPPIRGILARSVFEHFDRSINDTQKAFVPPSFNFPISETFNRFVPRCGKIGCSIAALQCKVRCLKS